MQSSSSRAIVRLSSNTTHPLLRSASRSARSFASVVDAGQKDPTELDQISTLANGIRVATEALPGAFSGIGVYVDAGSRYENEELRGVSHIIDRLAFKSTKSRTSDQMLETLESLGGNIQCASSRESLMYQSASFNAAVPTTLALLAETIREPLITDLEVQQQLETAEYEIREIWAKPELILPELVNVAAYKDNTLGNPLLCPQERLPFINKGTVENYRDTFFRPERIVVAFAGVTHDEALKLTERYFGDMKGSGPTLTQYIPVHNPTATAAVTASSTSSLSSSASSSTYTSPATTPPSSPRSGLLSNIPFLKNLSTSASQRATEASLPSSLGPRPIDLSIASHYTGGFLSLPNLPPPSNPALPHLSHIHLAFEALPISSDDIYALATLQTLLGGGGSFSAGGPGKGMYSRLYTNVLNQYGWVESCVAFNHSYTDSGLFGISASCNPGKIQTMLEVMCRELQHLSLDTGFSALKPVEVNRAKNQLRSSLLMNLESRMVELEDLGRQVQVHGRKVGVKEMCRKIDALTVHDLRRVAKQVLGGEVSNKGQGSGAPTVVLQEGQRQSFRPNLSWPEIQERIGKWKLGRRRSPVSSSQTKATMVQLEEVEDQDLVREQPGPYEEEEDEDYTDTDSSLSDDDDFPSSLAPSETALDRIYALKDIIPPSTRRSIASTSSNFFSALKSTALFSGKSLYVISTGGLMVLVPFMMATIEEQQIVEMEREQKAREMGSEIMSPGAQAGGLPGAPGAKASL
ncbi:MAG: hypothetical protein Q9171_007167 [Xanthocarpia ochracea]